LAQALVTSAQEGRAGPLLVNEDDRHAMWSGIAGNVGRKCCEGDAD